MYLYKADIWIESDTWRTVLVVSDSTINAIDKALGKIEEEEIIDIIVSIVDELDGYKIVLQ